MYVSLRDVVSLATICLFLVSVVIWTDILQAFS
jgi:hypothetical protein